MTVVPPTEHTDIGRVRTLVEGEEYVLAPLLAQDPVVNCFPAARVAEGGLSMAALGGYVLGYEVEGRLTSALLVGANLVPIATTPASRRHLVRRVVRMGRRSSSIVGPADEVADLWALLQPHWGPAREVRSHQPLMVARQRPTVAPDPGVRVTTPEEIDTIFPACVEMFTEEVGVSPTSGGAGSAYRHRIREIIESGRSFARFQDGRPVFKAELGAVTEHACQVQGVWVAPDTRGRGLGASGMAAVVDLARQRTPVVSLYVNDFNTAAIRAYRGAGFEEVGVFATVLL